MFQVTSKCGIEVYCCYKNVDNLVFGVVSHFPAHIKGDVTVLYHVSVEVL